jgi:hypothetical protein
MGRTTDKNAGKWEICNLSNQEGNTRRENPRLSLQRTEGQERGTRYLENDDRGSVNRIVLHCG